MRRIQYAQKLHEKNLITAEQLQNISDHEKAGVFSLRPEILFLFFASVIMFCTGAGVLIYKNIDSIGHIILLTIILALIVTCFYLSFKNLPGYSRTKVENNKPVYDYVVLAGNMLLAVFIAYLHAQYQLFGARFDLATLIPTAIFFASAYYFDHKGLLSMGVGGLCTFIGFSVSRYGLLQRPYENTGTTYAIILSALIVLFAWFSEKKELKAHFSPLLRQLAMHILGVSALILLTGDNWLFPAMALAAGSIYFYRVSVRELNMPMLVFCLLYAASGLSILLVRGLLELSVDEGIIYMSPFYVAAIIALFVNRIKHLKNQSRA